MALDPGKRKDCEDASFGDAEMIAMRERRRKRRIAKRKRRSKYRNPSVEAIERIRHINQLLTETQIWIMDNMRRRVAEYRQAGGIVDYTGEDVDWNDWTDYMVEVHIKFSLGENDPDFDPLVEHNNRITRLSRMIMPDDTLDKEYMTGTNWNEGIHFVDALTTTHFCYLFHELYNHNLSCNWEQFLRIGEIWIELVCTRQRGLKWGNHAASKGETVRSRPVSVFSNFDDYARARRLNHTERHYADVLNWKTGLAEEWLLTQNREAEAAFLASRDGRCGFIDENTYEDYVLVADISAMLGEWHPEYVPEMDNILCSFRVPLCKRDEKILGRYRNSWWDESLRHMEECVVSDRHLNFYGQGPIGKKRITNLFHAIHEQLNKEWSRTLNVGELTLDANLIQRRIIRF